MTPGNSKWKTFFQITGMVIGLFALIVQLRIILSNVPENGYDYLSGTIFFLSFMTIWTNIIVTLSYTVSLLASRSELADFFNKPSVQAGILLYITVVMIVYHFLLASLWKPQGWQLAADNLLHYVVPLLYIVYWILFAKKGQLKWKYAVHWLVYPIVYFIYAMIYGVITGTYMYPFIDIANLGISTVILNALLVFSAYLILGLVIIFVDNLAKNKKISIN